MTTTPFRRDGRPYRELVSRFRAHSEAARSPCWLCSQPIDYRLPRYHPDSFSADHALTVRDHPELAMSWDNLRPAHLDCNQRRGTDEPRIDLGTPSRIW